MTKEFDIQDYMTRGVERVVADAVRATLKNPKESAYMARFAMSSKNASAKRKKMEKMETMFLHFLSQVLPVVVTFIAQVVIQDATAQLRIPSQ